MIINPFPELEELLVNGSHPPSVRLLHVLEKMQIGYKDLGDKIVIDPSLEPLDERQVMSELADVLSPSESVRFEIYRDIGSTNEQVLANIEYGQLYICLAEHQTAGKGRRGRRWVSPFGHNLYLSIGCYLQGPLEALGGLSLLVGMRTVDVLRDLGLSDVGLKWPNDLILDRGKLGGILIEFKSQEGRGIGVVVGTGINLRMSDHHASQIDQNWSATESHLNLSRNVLAGRLSAKLIETLREFDRHGFGNYVSLWQDYNLFAGQEVCVTRGLEQFNGIDRGIDEKGNLLLDTDDGMQMHNSGEVSLRPISDQ